MTMIPCDGCGDQTAMSEIGILAPTGLQVRYCPACVDVWRSFERTLNAETARMQTLNEIFQKDARKKCPLHLTPLDFPAVARDDKGNPVTLR